ncbi:MAG: IS1380 family transposase [Actinobacteria bacterium]|nr:IS1380 family transposase [Actinomycetota bacterium]
MDTLRDMRRLRRRVRVGAPDPWLTPVSGMAAVSELVARLGMIKLLDAAVGRIKARDRGLSGGQLLVGLATVQLAGEDFLVGLDRQRADVAGQVLAPVAGLSSTTAAGLARRLSDGQWRAVETGIGDIHTAMLAALPPQRAAALCDAVTIDLDTTDVEVYGRKKRGVAYNYQGQRCGRPHVATWAQTATVLAAELMAGNEDPRPHAPELLNRALGALPAAARSGRIRLRADAGYFAGALARAAHLADVEFAIGAKRIAPLWRILDGVTEQAWTEAIDMDGAQVAVASYGPDWWPAATRLLIRRVRLDIDTGQVSRDPRARRRRTLRPDQRALPIAQLADLDAVYGYSFIVTNLDVSTPDKAAAIEHWYRHRTAIENIFRDSKLGAALRHLPSGYPEINRAWMWGALLATSITGWLHQLTATPGPGPGPGPGTTLLGHGVREGQAMIATLRHRLIRVPARLVRHAGKLTLRLPPGYHLLTTVLARLRALPTTP